MQDNLLYFGDNLEVLAEELDDESVGLVYADPPFNSNKVYNAFFPSKDGGRASAQEKAFEDTWEWTDSTEWLYRELICQGNDLSTALQAFDQLLGSTPLMAYLVMMAPRLEELRRVLKPTGSIYLHCDPTASHYLKILMDAVFGPRNFRNEIVWHYGGWTHQKMSHFPRKHDTLLFYSKSDLATYHPLSIPWTREEYLALRKQAIRTDEDGREYIYDRRGAAGQRRYVDVALAEGRPVDSVWDIRPLTSSAKERLGYPTQKPEALLERIIQASSEEGDTVLDPFCGCGTAIASAQRLGRRWIGIDISSVAIRVIRQRLRDAFGDAVTYSMDGFPTTADDARDLAEHDKFQFQRWVLTMVDAVNPRAPKRGADRGIDGRILFFDEGARGRTKQVIISVKGGHTGVADLRDLRGVLDREGAEIGVLITLNDSTQPMRQEAAHAGIYRSPGWNTTHPRLQVLTVADLFNGRRPDYPAPKQTTVTYRRAPRATPVVEQRRLQFGRA